CAEPHLPRKAIRCGKKFCAFIAEEGRLTNKYYNTTNSSIQVRRRRKFWKVLKRSSLRIDQSTHTAFTRRNFASWPTRVRNLQFRIFLIYSSRWERMIEFLTRPISV